MFQNQLSKKQQERAQALQQDITAAAAAPQQNNRAGAQRASHQQQQQQQQQSRGDGGGSGAPGGGAGGVGKPLLDPKNWKQDKDYYIAVRNAQQAPITQKIKRVVDLLKKERRGMNQQEITTITLVEMTEELLASLRKNPKIAIDGDVYRYKAKYDLASRDDLLFQIRKHKDGLLFEEIADSYPEVRAHVEELRSAGDIWILSISEGSEEIVLYPNDPRLKKDIQVDEDVAQFVRDIEIPKDLASQKHSLSNKVRQQYAMSHAIIRPQKPKGKRKRESKNRKTTNDHLPDLFADTPQPK